MEVGDGEGLNEEDIRAGSGLTGTSAHGPAKSPAVFLFSVTFPYPARSKILRAHLSVIMVGIGISVVQVTASRHHPAQSLARPLSLLHSLSPFSFCSFSTTPLSRAVPRLSASQRASRSTPHPHPRRPRSLEAALD
jgi:hypothetical protein